jgi:hypothetical protein
MPAQRRIEDSGQHGHPVLASLGFPNDELTPLEREVLDPQAQGLHEAQSAAVEQVGHQPGGALQLRQERAHLGTAQRHWPPPRR